jgi:2-polyprenyl-6-methoxyphenol hydroxylase-like FAD-dependent oxidoreductase
VVTAIKPGEPPQVQLREAGSAEALSARLVVASEGRNSAARGWADFEVKRQPHPFLFASVLFSGMAMSHDLCHYFFNAPMGTVVGIVYEGEDRFRAYLEYPADEMERLQGEQALLRFLEQSRKTTVLPQFYDGEIRGIGPLASFSCDEDWLEHPYSNGVALMATPLAPVIRCSAKGYR